jgi:hypothetical protein
MSMHRVQARWVCQPGMQFEMGLGSPAGDAMATKKHDHNQEAISMPYQVACLITAHTLHYMRLAAV